MSEVYVRSVGLWSPGYPNADSWVESKRDAECETPASSRLRGSLRRRATSQTRAAIEVFDQVVSRAGWDGSTVFALWGTAHGEHATSISMFEGMARGEGKVSPTQFHNSVHNAAGGYASIAEKNTMTSTTLTGGGELVMSGFLEASSLLRAGGHEVVLIFFDEPLQGPFAVPGMEAGLAVGFGLTNSEEGAMAKLEGFGRAAAEGVHSVPPYEGMHIAAALPLLEHVVAGHPGRVALQIDGEPGPVWCTKVAPL